MGRLVETLAPEYGFEVTGVIARGNAGAAWPDAEVAIDFSAAGAVPVTIQKLAPRGSPLALGTTGWQSREQEIRDSAARHGIGVVAAPNFAIGVNLFLALIERAGALLSPQPGFGAWIHELHHAAKKDAPSGTALAMQRLLTQ